MTNQALFCMCVVTLALRCSGDTSQFTSTFQGCFGGNGASLAEVTTADDNLNSRCSDHCRDNAYAVAVTKGRLCACSNTLLDLMPRLARPEDGNATGAGSPCNTRCPGTPGTGECEFDTCCGGPTSYSVFIVGNIDSVKAVLSRAQAALEENDNARLKAIWSDMSEELLSEQGTRLVDKDEKIEKYLAAVDPIACRNACAENRDSCGGASYTNSWPGSWANCVLFEYGGYTRLTGQDGWYSFEFIYPGKQLAVEVATTATPLDAKGEQTGTKTCTMSSTNSYSCTASSEVNPSATVILEASAMERQLVQDLGSKLQPLGKYDFEEDNTGSNTTAQVTKIVRIRQTESRGWHTDAGADISYSMGTRFSTTAGVETFGLSASASAEVSAELKVGGFFSAGYAKTTTSTIQDEVRVQYTVPPGEKLQINFFKETYTLEVKWRAILIASGKIRVKVAGLENEFYLSEVLSLAERTIFAFGQIDLGDREKIVSIATRTSGQGAVVFQERKVKRVT